MPGLWLAGALLVGAALVALISHWRKQSERDLLSANEQLAHYRSLYEEGAISEEEYHQLRGLLGGEIRRSAGVKAKPHQRGKEDQSIRPPDPPVPPSPPEQNTDQGIRPA